MHLATPTIQEQLTEPIFDRLSSVMGGTPYIKLVVETETGRVHFINSHQFSHHAKYIGSKILHLSEEDLMKQIDDLNKSFYYGEDRKYYLGILSYHENENKSFYTLETTEVDDMKAPMLMDFYQKVLAHVSRDFNLFMKPSNFLQEQAIESFPQSELPRVYMHELMQSKSFIALHDGVARGRLRLIESLERYDQLKESLTWYDIIVMDRVPEDIPRVAGIINTSYTTPLSHTNILASGWEIPNCIELNITSVILKKDLDEKWVYYKVSSDAAHIELEEIKAYIPERPVWTSYQVVVDSPTFQENSILSLADIRLDHRSSFGTKAASLGEVNHLLLHPSQKSLGFYQVPHPPRENLIPYLNQLIGARQDQSLVLEVQKFLRRTIKVPRGIAIPFSFNRDFLNSSPAIQQMIGKLKMAIELEAPVVDSLCIELQQLIRATKMQHEMKDRINEKIAQYMSGVEKFVVRSSSNAEDLEHFSAAGIYESYNHQTCAENIFESVKKVWASLVSPRSVKLRQEVGISLDVCYMGVIIQEEVPCDMGGVLVSKNPSNAQDFRNVYVNASTKSAIEVVQGTDRPYQLLYNVVEGACRTLAKDTNVQDLSERQHCALLNFSVASKLLQSHFSPDFTYKLPVDIEWALGGDQVYLLQIRPFNQK